MPAPPHSSGMQMPSRCRSAIPFKKPRSKRCSRSRSWILGATSRPAQSRTVCPTAWCSSDSSNEIMRVPLRARRWRRRAAPPDGLEALFGVLGGHELVEVDVLGVADGDGERLVEAPDEGPARELQDGRAALLEALDEGGRLGFQLVVGDGAADKADALGLRRR